MAPNSIDPISETAPRRPSSRMITSLSNTAPPLPFRGAFPSFSFKPGRSPLFRPKPPHNGRGRSHGNEHDDKTRSKKVTFHWVKGELLGKGSYARVYLGLNATTGEIMAVKQVELPQTPSDRMSNKHREIADALKFERKTLMGLDHPNIVQYLGYEESPTYLSIFLEYVPGGTISSCLQTYEFSDEVTKSFTQQILEGLHYLHGVGIIHRDLKSDNILVVPSGVCKISDFGISKQVEDISKARAYTGMRGTIYWMAPEILDNGDKQGYDLKVDIWSIGCVVLEMWTGKRPWFGEEPLPVMMKLYQDKLAPPIPPDLVLNEAALDFRMQCFQKNPQDRPSAAELRGHQYLMLPSNWRFEPFEHCSPRRSPSRTSRKSQKSFKPLSNTSEAIPPTHAVSTSVEIRNPTYRNSTYRPAGSNVTLHAGPQHRRHESRQKVTDGPRVVIITPPNSPPSPISQLPNNSRSSLETAGSVSTPIKGFRVVNPDDPDLQTNRKPFVYNPPPLPSMNGGSPFSSRLQPISNYGVPEVYPPSLHSRTQSTSSVLSSRQKVASHYSDRRRTQGSRPNSEYSETDSEDGDDIWKKPPSDLTDKDEPMSPVSRLRGQSRAASVIGSPEEWPRPAQAAVYENLQDFFPQYDLDKAVVPITSADTPSKERGHDKKKSIRIVAEDRAQCGPQRGTKLWDSKVEELHM